MKKLFKFTVGVASVAAIIGGGYYFLKKHVLDYIKDDFDDFDDFDDPEDFDDFEEFDLGGVKARYIKYLGGGNSSNSYNSVGELQVTEKK